MRTPSRAFLLVSCLLPVACSGHVGGTVVVTKRPHHVSIRAEVFDPETNFVWEGVAVRVVEGEMEWSGCVCPNPDPEDWRFTDAHGIVDFTPRDLAEARIGFMEDDDGLAILSPHPLEDEAFVLLEVAAPGFETVFVDVKLTWTEDDVFISVPFRKCACDDDAHHLTGGGTPVVARTRG